MNLTPQNNDEFDRLGLTLIDDVLSERDLAQYSAAIDRFYADRNDGIVGYIEEPGLYDLLQHPNLERIAKHILDAEEVSFASCACLYKRPTPGATEWKIDENAEHADIQFTPEEMDARPRVMLAMMMVFVDDLPPGRGNTWVRLGSHRIISQSLNGKKPNRITATKPSELPEQNYGPLTPVVAKKGQVAAFTTALLHVGSNNIDTQPRKILFVNFTPRGMRDAIVGDYRDNAAAIKYRDHLRHHFRPDRLHLLEP